MINDLMSNNVYKYLFFGSFLQKFQNKSGGRFNCNAPLIIKILLNIIKFLDVVLRCDWRFGWLIEGLKLGYLLLIFFHELWVGFEEFQELLFFWFCVIDDFWEWVHIFWIYLNQSQCYILIFQFYISTFVLWSTLKLFKLESFFQTIIFPIIIFITNLILCHHHSP